MSDALPGRTTPKLNLTDLKLEKILDPAHPLCKEEVVWMLEFIKKKVTEADPKLADLSQPRLLQNFRYFAEIALMLIQRRNGFDQEADRLKDWLNEASFGLRPAAAGQNREDD